MKGTAFFAKTKQQTLKVGTAICPGKPIDSGKLLKIVGHTLHYRQTIDRDVFLEVHYEQQRRETDHSGGG